MSRPRVEAVERALSLLECFNQQRQTMTLTELAEATGMYKSTVLRLAASLEHFHFLVRRQDGRFGVGQALWRLGQLYRSSFDIEHCVRPELVRLMEATGETASLYIREGDSRVCLYRENSRRAARHHLDEGTTLPLTTGASGHVLAAFADGMAAMDRANNAGADTAGVGDDAGEDAVGMMSDVLQKGYAVSLGERDPDIAAIAVPVFAQSGDLVGALALSGIITRFTPDNQAAMLGSLREAAARLQDGLR